MLSTRSRPIAAYRPSRRADTSRPIVDRDAETIHPPKRREPVNPIMLLIASFVLFSALLWGPWIGLLLLGWAFHT